MNVLLIGANGQIGQIITEKMQEIDDLNLTAAYRKDDQMNEAQARGINVAKVDLEKDMKHLEEVMSGMDAVIFAAGSGGSTGADKTMMVDLDGAVKAIEAARRKNVKRFVMISALNANRREVWSYGLENSGAAGYYYAAKYYADNWLLESGLDYTIIRPSALLNEPGTGKVKIDEYLETKNQNLEIPREDVASVVIASLQDENAVNKDFDLTEGTDSISDALAKL
jgi:uncharacterized protein YbjT (DUF2867 family)